MATPEAIKKKADDFLDKHARRLLFELSSEITDGDENNLVVHLAGLAEAMEMVCELGVANDAVREGFRDATKALGFLIQEEQEIQMIEQEEDQWVKNIGVGRKGSLLSMQSDLIDLMKAMGISRGPDRRGR